MLSIRVHSLFCFLTDQLLHTPETLSSRTLNCEPRVACSSKCFCQGILSQHQEKLRRQVRCHILVILELWKYRLKDQGFKAILSYTYRG